MRKLFEKIKASPVAVRYREDREFRTVVRALFSSATTAAVGVYDLVLAAFAGLDGIWLDTLGIYCCVLSVARIAVLCAHRVGVMRKEEGVRKKRRDAGNYLFGGALLVFITLAYSGVIVLVTAKGYHYTYRGNMVYVMALYAFYKVISATVRAVRGKKFSDHTTQTFRNIDFADGVVSIVALQTALLSAFSSAEEEAFALTMNAAVGGVAGVLLLALGSYMIVRGARLLSALKYEDQTADEAL